MSSQGQPERLKIIQKAGHGAMQIGKIIGSVTFHQVSQLFSNVQLLVLVLFLTVTIPLSGWLFLRQLRATPLVAVPLPATPAPCSRVDVINPREMTGGFNAALARFGEMDTRGSVRRSADGDHLSRWVFDQVLDDFKRSCSDIAVQLWHDSLEPAVKAVEIGAIQGDTKEKRSAAAALVAEAIKADVIIYGHLDVHQGLVTFTPEFYVADQPEIEDIVGQHQLGTPIPIQLPVDSLSSRLQLNEKLLARIKVLSLFTFGLAWESVNEPAKALDFFYQAEQVEGWADSEGKEIVYLFIGRELNSLGQFEAAQEAFGKALQLNPDYARAHLGLGNTYYGLAQQRLYDHKERHPLLQQIEAAWEQAELERAAGQAIAEYEAALVALGEAPGRHLAVKVHIALGGGYRLKGEIFRRYGKQAAAGPLFDLSIDQFQEAIALAGEQHQLLSQAYLGLGMAYHLQAYTLEDKGEQKALLQEAVGAYQQCIDQAGLDPADWRLAGFKTDFCGPYQNEAQKNLQTLEKTGGDE